MATVIWRYQEEKKVASVAAIIAIRELRPVDKIGRSILELNYSGTEVANTTRCPCTSKKMVTGIGWL